ncbi:TIGR03826 family flagellar region protein [Alicyclobacillus sp.]|uniref:TIGR03826 family flagellar region protein n=1 Tax=Alicyclobacillus sp. TaxID=61169 RepID=UPI0025C26BCE|nr:TIGR03826 family flagellar region protein [Alicyclobacillus sp.]MCL6517454.1 hypothetical protein [Alicyclobacillus sp.]
MPIANCKRCGRLFNKIRRDICPACVAEEDKAFDIVRQYLREHRDATMAQVSEETGVGVDLIISMIQDGRLMLRDNPNLHYPCERCGKPTRAGRFCPACTKELSAGLGAAARELRKKAEQTDSQGRGYYSRG